MHEHLRKHHMRCKMHMMGMGPGMGCHGGHGMDHDPRMDFRHFLTGDEKIEHLERYREWLEKESKGVHEAIEEMKSKK